MTTTIRKRTSLLRGLLFSGMALMTTLLLLISSTAFPVPGSSLIAAAHAAAREQASIQGALRSSCAADPTATHCNGQDPIAQGCSTDAQTLSFKEIFDQQDILLATVQRRYSPTCQSEWGRIIESSTDHEPIGVSIGSNAIRSTPGPIAFSAMVFVPNLSIAAEIIGTVSTNGMFPGQPGSKGWSTTLPALPATLP